MKKPVGAEKKRVKRSSGSASTSVRDSGSDSQPRVCSPLSFLSNLFYKNLFLGYVSFCLICFGL
jgi:hypothetical protein